jgi:hypothetical protein
MAQGANASELQSDGVEIHFLLSYFDLFSRNPGEVKDEYSEGFHHEISSYHGDATRRNII